VWSPLDALRGLRRLLPTIRRRSREADESDHPSGRRIRRIYRELLRVGSGLGAPRIPSATPREHDPRLRAVLPTTGEEVDLLTSLYERVRYGAWQAPAAAVQAADEALRRVRASLSPKEAGE
jgi:hypothetical protein